MYTAKWLDIILYLGCIQGFFLTFLLWQKRPANQQAVNYLMILVGLVSLLIFGRVNYQPEWLREFALIIMLPDVILFLAGPLLWFFVRSLLQMPLPPTSIRWLHFIPAIFHCTVLNLVIGLSLTRHINFLSTVQIVGLFHLIEIGAILSLSYYLAISFRDHKHYASNYNQDFSSPLKTRFLQYFFLTLLLMIVVWISGYVRNLILKPDYTIYSVVWIVITFGIYYLAYMVLTHTAILALPKIDTAVASSDYTENIAEKVDILKQFMANQRPYLDSTVKLADLAEQIGWTKHDLSKIINQGFSINFFDFINKYRIEDFIAQKKQQHRDGTPILELAFEVGFNSKSAFNRAFKKETGSSPSQFFKLNLGQSQNLSHSTDN